MNYFTAKNILPLLETRNTNQSKLIDSITEDIEWIAVDFDHTLNINNNRKYKSDDDFKGYDIHKRISGISYGRRKTYEQSMKILQISYKEVERVIDMYMTYLKVNTKLLNILIRSNKNLCILSNNFGYPIKRWLERNKIDKYFKFVLTPDSINFKYLKPQVEFYKYLLTKLELSKTPSSVLFIDDKESYIGGAIKAGLSTYRWT